MTIRIYTNSGGAFPAGTRTLIGTTNTTVANGTLFFKDIAVTAPVQSATTQIVVEVFTPDGQTVHNHFFIGSNNLGQSAPSYISAADCGAPNPTNVASAGVPNMHTLIALVGNKIPTAANVSISGRVITPQDLGLTNALVTLTDQHGNSRTILTGKFGNFRFDEVTPGETYILSVSSKRYFYAAQVVTPTENVTGITFTVQRFGKARKKKRARNKYIPRPLFICRRF